MSLIQSNTHKIAKICFWNFWLAAILLAYMQLPVLASSLNYWSLEKPNIPMQAILVVCGGVLFYFQSYHSARIAKFYETVGSIFESSFSERSTHLVGRFAKGLFRLLFLFGSLVLAGYALINPKTVFQKFLAVPFLIFCGLLIGKVLKEVTRNVFNRPLAGEMVENVALATFMLTAFSLFL